MRSWRRVCGTEIIPHDGLEVNEDGIVAITVDKLSTIAVAVEETTTYEVPKIIIILLEEK